MASPEVEDVALPVTVELESLLATAPVVLLLPEALVSVVEVEVLALSELAKPLEDPVGLGVLLAFAEPVAVASVPVACEELLFAASASLVASLVVEVAFEVAPEAEPLLATVLESVLVAGLVLDVSPALAKPLFEPVWLLVVSVADEEGVDAVEPEVLEVSLLAIELLLVSVDEAVVLSAPLLSVLAKPLLLPVAGVVLLPDTETEPLSEPLAEALWLWSVLL